MPSFTTCANGPERAPASRHAEAPVPTVDLLEFEHELFARGFRRVAGVDEAGRGPWAGPVVAAAVVLPCDEADELASGLLLGLIDSKQLTPARRERFFNRLTAHPGIQWAVTRIDAPEIDRLRIHRATYCAMAQALAQLDPSPGYALIDGRPVPDLPCRARAVVHGDARSLTIAAASVVAKVWRDRIMRDEADPAFPAYGFARHKGYGTAAHRAALERLGPCPLHRRSFAPIARWGGADGCDVLFK